MPDWTIILTIAGLAGLYVSVRRPLAGWALFIATQVPWFAFGMQSGRWWFAAGAPVYAGAGAWHLIRDLRRARAERAMGAGRWVWVPDGCDTRESVLAGR